MEKGENKMICPIKLTNLEKDYVDAFYCKSCNKIVIDLNAD